MNVFDDLKAAITAAEEAKAREALARQAVVDFLTETGEKGAKLPWANVSIVSTPIWEYRDGGVTTAKADVAKAETALKAAKALLKGAENAAKAAGGAKAKVTDTVTTLRIVKVAG
ncbi:MAG: hypothetical protein ACO3PY_06095 [Pontimonas sp.]|jgi:hypothetical protein